MKKATQATKENSILRWLFKYLAQTIRNNHLTMERNTMVNKIIMITFSALLFSSTHVIADNYSPYVDEQGNISLPKDFRIQMSHLGSWFVPNGDVSGFHDVYAEKESIQIYRKTGSFPDGATIIKELRSHQSDDYTTGADVSSATDIKLWFVMIKDTQNRFPDNKVWAEGWGWALINTSDPNKNTATDFKTDCMGCHLPAQKTDWVFIEGYPTLKTQ